MQIDHTLIVSRVKGLLQTPLDEWEIINNEHKTFTSLYKPYLLLLALVPPMSSLIGTTLFGWQIADESTARLTFFSALQLGIMFYLAMLAGVFLLGKSIDLLTLLYSNLIDEKQVTGSGFVLAGYAATPLFLAGVVTLYPVVWICTLAGTVAITYSIYLLYQGLPIVTKVPADKRLGFICSLLAIGLLVLTAIMAITAVIWVTGFEPIYK